MGCIGSKPATREYDGDGSKERLRLRRKESADKPVSRGRSTGREEVVKSSGRIDGGNIKVMLIDKKESVSNRYYGDQVEKKSIDKYELIERNRIETGEITFVGHLGGGIERVPKSAEGELVVAGWPAWLAAVAGESLKGWLPRKANTFEKLAKIGQGTYSSVYKARDVITNKFVALKKVRFDNKDPESIKFMAREIVLLRRLDHPNIIKLEGLITSSTSCNMYLVFEYMEHDLVGLASLPDIKFSEPQIKCYMKQLLSGLEHCHSHGVLHRDIKGSNLLIDGDGILKIADFGLASSYDASDAVTMTSRVVTLWYRPPELLLGATHYGVAVDLWSAGCILGELYAGKPILPGKTEVEQLHKIFKLCGSPSEDYWRKSKLPHSTAFKPVRPYKRCVAETYKSFPSSALSLIETLLSMEPIHRGTADSALKSEFFTTEPLACDPSTLPKYPPSKEIDAKLRDEEARRKRAVVSRGQRIDTENRGPKASLAITTPNTNGEPATSMQRRQPYPYLKNRNESSNSNKQDTVSGFQFDSSRNSQGVREGSRDFSDHNKSKVSFSGPLVNGAGGGKFGKEADITLERANLSKMSGLVASRTLASEERREMPSCLPQDEKNQAGRSQKSVNESASAAKQDLRSRTQRVADSPQSGTRTFKGNKIYVSGPLLSQSDNVEQMIKEHERKIQEYSRQARHEKNKPGRVRA